MRTHGKWGLLLVGILGFIVVYGLWLRHERPFAAGSRRPTPPPATAVVRRSSTPTPVTLHVRAYARVGHSRPPYSLPQGTSSPPAADVPLPPEDAYGIPPLPHVITYTVRPGDTLSRIASRFGISLDSLRWSNPEIEHNPDDIYPGQVLHIPPLNGVVVRVKEGDTVEKLARRYHVPPDVIRTYAANHLRPPYTLTPGTFIIVPGGHRETHILPPRPYPGYDYMWPVRGIITQRFHKYHHGLDIATAYGAGVYAARSGRVRTVRWDDTGYGYMVIIDHGGGWNTLYAHLKGALVRPGQWVKQGDLIGRVGGTGRATGPHVHFEIRKGRTRYDPETFLPPHP